MTSEIDLSASTGGNTTVIDVHSHCLPASVLEYLRVHGESLHTNVLDRESGKAEIVIRGTTVGIIDEAFWSQEIRLNAMDRQGIDVAVLSCVPYLFYYDVEPSACLGFCQVLNDSIAEMVRARPDRFAGLATVPLQDVNLAIKELRRAIGDLGLAGVQIGTNVLGKNLDESQFEPFFKAAEESEAFILVHPHSVIGADRLRKYHFINLIGFPLETTIFAGSLLFGGVFDRFPRLKVCLVHSGGYVPWIIGRWDHGYEVRTECKANIKNLPSTYISKFYFDTIAFSSTALKFAIDTVGYDRFLLGTDYPFDMGDSRHCTEIVALEGLEESQKAAILGQTAKESLRLNQ